MYPNCFYFKSVVFRAGFGRRDWYKMWNVQSGKINIIRTPFVSFCSLQQRLLHQRRSRAGFINARFTNMKRDGLKDIEVPSRLIQLNDLTRRVGYEAAVDKEDREIVMKTTRKMETFMTMCSLNPLFTTILIGSPGVFNGVWATSVVTLSVVCFISLFRAWVLSLLLNVEGSV